MLKLPKLEEVNEQTDKVVTMLQKYQGDNTAFLKSFAQQDAMILRFDEIISTKVSKVSMIEEIKDFDEKMDTRFTIIK